MIQLVKKIKISTCIRIPGISFFFEKYPPIHTYKLDVHRISYWQKGFGNISYIQFHI